jgi:hypothetical protein
MPASRKGCGAWVTGVRRCASFFFFSLGFSSLNAAKTMHALPASFTPHPETKTSKMCWFSFVVQAQIQSAGPSRTKAASSPSEISPTRALQLAIRLADRRLAFP